MRTLGIEMRSILSENCAKVSLTEDDDVVNALASYSPKESLDCSIHPRRARCSQHNFYVGPFSNSIERSAILGVSIPNQNLRPLPKRGGLA